MLLAWRLARSSGLLNNAMQTRGLLAHAAAAAAAQPPPPQPPAPAAHKAAASTDPAWRRVLSLLAANDSQANAAAELSAALAQLASQQQRLPAQQLLPVLRAAAALQQQQPQPQQQQQQLLRLFTAMAVASLPQLQPQQLAAVLTALRDLQQQLPAVLRKAVQAYLQQQQRALDASSTAAIAAALAAFKHQRGGSLTVLAMLALDHLPAMDAAQLVQTVGAFADAQHYNQAVCDAAAQRALAIIQQQGFRLRAVEGAAAAGCPDAAAAATSEKQQQPSGNFSASQLVSLLRALSQLRHYDPSLLEAACACLLRSPQRSLEHLVSLVHTCAVLNHLHRQLFEAAVARAEHAMQQQQNAPCSSSGSSGSSTLSQLLATLSWSCGTMGHWEPDFLQRLLVWSGQVDPQQLSTQELLAWHEVQTSLTDAALRKPQASPDGLSSSLLVATQAAWASRQQSPRLTAFQKEVVEALQQAGGRCRLNVVLDGPVVVDVALLQRQVGARYRVALQLHPPDDFAANPPYGALGPTAARWRALQARGWRVVTLKQSDWNRLKTKQQQVEYAWQLAQGVEVTAPGMSHVVSQVLVGPQEAPKRRKQSLPQTLMRILLEGH